MFFESEALKTRTLSVPGGSPGGVSSGGPFGRPHTFSRGKRGPRVRNKKHESARVDEKHSISRRIQAWGRKGVLFLEDRGPWAFQGAPRRTKNTRFPLFFLPQGRKGNLSLEDSGPWALSGRSWVRSCGARVALRVLGALLGPSWMDCGVIVVEIPGGPISSPSCSLKSAGKELHKSVNVLLRNKSAKPPPHSEAIEGRIIVWFSAFSVSLGWKGSFFSRRFLFGAAYNRRTKFLSFSSVSELHKSVNVLLRS